MLAGVALIHGTGVGCAAADLSRRLDVAAQPERRTARATSGTTRICMHSCNGNGARWFRYFLFLLSEESAQVFPPPRAGEGRGGSNRGVRKDRGVVHLSTVDGCSNAQLAKIGSHDIGAVLRRGHHPVVA